MSDYLARELAGDATRSNEVDPRITNSMRIVGGDTGSLLQEEVAKRAQELHNRRIESLAEESLALAEPDPAYIASLASRYNQIPTGPEAIDAAASMLAGAETQERQRLLFEQSRLFREQRETTRAETMRSLSDRIAEIQMARLDRSEWKGEGKPNAATAALSAFDYTAQTVVEFLDSFALPGYWIEAINIIKDVDPQAGTTIGDYVQPADALAALPKIINSMEPEKAAAARERLLQAIRTRSGRIMDENLLAEKTFLEEFLAAFETDQAGDKSIISNIFAPLDLVFGVGGLAVDGVSAARGAYRGLRSLWSFTPETPVHILTPYVEGARSVASAALGGRVIDGEFSRMANAEQLLADMGTSKAQAVGTLYLPKPPLPDTIAPTPPTPGPYRPRPGGNVYEGEFTRVGDELLLEDSGIRQLTAPKASAASAADDAPVWAATQVEQDTAISTTAGIRRGGSGSMTPPSGAGQVEAIRSGNTSGRGGAGNPPTPPPPPSNLAASGPGGSPYTPPSGLPFFDEFYLSPAERANAAQAVEQGLKAEFSVRLNDLVISQGQGGTDALVRIGSGKGVGFNSTAEAEAWAAQNLNVPFNVVKDQAGTFQVEFKHLYPYLIDDVGEFIDPIRGYGIGKGARFTDWLARSSTAAELNTVKAQKINAEIADTFAKLTGDDSLRVQNVLLKGEENFVEYSRANLVDMGLSAKEIEGYESVRRLTKKVWTLKNEAAHFQLKAAGFTGEISVDGGSAFVKVVDPAQLTGADRLLNQSIRAVDLTSGTKVSLANVDLSKYTLYRFFEDTKSGYSYGIAPKSKPVTVRPLPDQILKNIPGWMPRYYNAPFFVRRVDADGRTTAMMTARSLSAGEEAVGRLSAQNPGEEFRVFRASEVVDEAESLADVAMLREQGLLVTSHRKPFALMDAEGGVAAISVQDSIDRMVSSAALQEGIGRWTTAMKIRFDNTYGKRLGFTMDLARAPVAPRDATLEPLFNEAMAIYNHVRLVNGLGSAGPAGQFVRGLRNRVADVFYNFGGKTSKVPVLGTVSRWMGDEISGLNPRAVRLLKSAAFVSYIGLNPVSQGILQMSMIPTYAGVRHALSYMATGKFAADALILQFAKDPLKIKQIANALGLKSKYVDDLLRDYNNSGLQQMVDNHLSVLGTFGDERVATSGKVRRAMAGVFNASKTIGFDLGVSADKRAAWLVMRNRALKDGKKWDATTMKEVAQDAEALTGNLNRSDSLFAPDGLMSAFLQFQSHGLKMANRIVGGVTGGRLGGESGLSGSEQRNVLLAALISWGLGGYGVVELVDRIDAKMGGNLSEEAKLVLNEGFAGAILNGMIRLADEDGEVSKVMASQRFSPFTQSGTMLTNAAEIAKLAVTMNWDQLENFMPAAASLGFTGRMADTYNFAMAVAGLTELPPEDKALAIASDFFRKFPVVNNALQAHMAYNLGYKFDSRGRPVVEAATGEAIASVLGLKSYSQYAVERASFALYGEYEPMDDKALTNELEAAARGTLEWMVPLLMRLGEGEIDYTLASELLNSHNVAMRTGLDPSEWAYYRDTVARELMKTEIMKGDRLADTLAKSVLDGDVRLSSFRDRLYGLDIPNKENLINVVESMFEPRSLESE